MKSGKARSTDYADRADEELEGLRALANPSRGKGERYIYCPIDGECVDLAARKGWRAFHCGGCEIFKKSSLSQGSQGTRRKPVFGSGLKPIKEKRSDYMSDEKNQLIDLNDSLFRQMERLADKDLDEEGLHKEILRSKAVSNLAAQIIQNARLALDGAKAIKAGLADPGTLMLGRGKTGE